MDLLYEQPPECDGLSLSTLPKATHRKQLMYCGKFTKREGGKILRFAVDPKVLDHWSRTGNEMIAAGVGIPMPKGHTEDPEAKRGEVVQFERGYDSKGRDALFAHFNFKDQTSAEDLKASDVSIFVPDEWTGTDEKRYKYPIRHVAFTDYPVIPGLDPSESIAASYEPETPKPETDMALRDYAKKLGLTVADDATDDQVQTQIEAHYDDALTKAKSEATPADPPKEPDTPAAPAVDEKNQPAPLAAGFVTMAVRNREGDIEGLVQRGKITPAAAKALKEKYASKEKVGLALSNDGTFTDQFDGVLEALELNQAIALSETTGGQTRDKLPTVADDENALTKNAKKRAEAAKR